MSQYDVDLREYWRIIKKRKMVIVLVMVFVALCSYAFSKFKEPSPLFRAESAVKIEQQTDFSFIRSAGLWVQTESMDTHAYTMTSFPVLKGAATKMDWIPASLSDEEVRKNNEYLSIIDRLKDMVGTEVRERTSIINIKVTSGDARESAAAANAVAAAYREFNIAQKNQRTLDIKEFIENQLNVLSERLGAAETKLREFREMHGMFSANEKTREIKNQISQIQKSLQETSEHKNIILNQINKINTASQSLDLAAEIAKQMSYSGGDSPLSKIGAKLDALLSERQGLLSKYTEKHPAVIDKENQIQQIVNDAGEDLRMYFDTLLDRESMLEEQKAQLEQDARRLPEKEHELAKLEMEAVLQAKLYSDLQARHQEVLIQESGKMDFVTIVKPAFPPARPFNIPSNMMIIFTGLVLGLILGLVFAFGMEMFDTSIGTIEDIETSLNVPVLGIIPHLGGGEDVGKKTAGNAVLEVERTRDLITHYDTKSLAAEAFRSLRTNLQFVKAEQKNKTILITSAFVKEGKTLNTVNLGLSLAQTGKKVLIIDADLRRSMVHKIFDLPRTPGLTEYILGDYQWRDVVNTITDVMLGGFKIDDILKTPGLDNLHIITAGTKPPNPTEILNSSRFRELLKEAGNEYHYVLLDSPPVLPVADPCEIAPYTDGVILVYTAGRIARGVLKRAKATLDNIDANVIGVILNNVKPEVGPDYFKYHTYYYYGPEKASKSDGKTGIRKFFSLI